MAEDMLNFVCWLWTPYPGVVTTKKEVKFTYADVNILYNMLKKYYRKPFKLICVTDNPFKINKDIEIVPLWDEFRDKGGCFPRLRAFKKGMDSVLGKRFVSIDLDCVIVSDITSLFERKEDFVIWKSGNTKNRFCGSMWMLRTNTKTIVYDSFHPDEWIPNRKGRFHRGTDQAQIARTLPNAATWTKEDGVISYKSLRSPVLPKKTKIVFFNGNFHPRQNHVNLKSPWIKEHYKLSTQEVEAQKEEARNRDPLNILCFYWQGKNRSGWGDISNAHRYINNLYTGVKKNLTLPFKFYCYHSEKIELTNIDPDIELVPFSSPSWRKNDAKLKMFDTHDKLKGRIITLDLDLVITGNLDEMFSYDGSFMTREAFREPGLSGGDLVFFSNDSKVWPFWELLCKGSNSIKRCNGNERFVYRWFFTKEKYPIDYIQRLYPDQIFSYKNHIKKTRKLPPNCRIVSCHGKDRPHLIKDRWIKQYWR